VPWVRDYAYDNGSFQVKPHYDMVYPYQSHLGRGTSFGSVAVGVGGGVQQLQRRGIGGPWFMAGFGRVSGGLRFILTVWWSFSGIGTPNCVTTHKFDSCTA